MTEDLHHHTKSADDFIPNIIETKKIYFFRYQNEPGSLLTRSMNSTEGESIPIIPIWSSNYLSAAKEYGEGNDLEEISLDDFYFSLLPYLIYTDFLIGINWNFPDINSGIEPRAHPMNLLEELVHRKSEWYEG